jgi:hypothetical protein
MKKACVAIALGGGLVAMSDAACWASFNQSLRFEGHAPTADAVDRDEDATPFVVAQQMVQAKTKTPQPTLAIGREPSGADFVNRQLNPGPSDPNVPMPRAGLTEEAAGPDAPKGTQLYGRTGDGGAVFGFKVPFPADQNGSSSNTRSGVGPNGPATPEQRR